MRNDVQTANCHYRSEEQNSSAEEYQQQVEFKERILREKLTGFLKDTLWKN